MRICGKCGESNETKFYPTGRWCRVCQREAVRDGRYRKLGVSRDEYLAVLHGQHGGCEICGAQEKPVAGTQRGLHLDHNHVTGKRRGILCARCNQLLGRSNESVELLQSIIDYIQRYRMK